MIGLFVKFWSFFLERRHQHKRNITNAALLRVILVLQALRRTRGTCIIPQFWSSSGWLACPQCTSDLFFTKLLIFFWMTSMPQLFLELIFYQSFDLLWDTRNVLCPSNVIFYQSFNLLWDTLNVPCPSRVLIFCGIQWIPMSLQRILLQEFWSSVRWPECTDCPWNLSFYQSFDLFEQIYLWHEVPPNAVCRLEANSVT